MSRKITKNLNQYKITLPIGLVKSLGWDDSTEIELKLVSTPQGKGILVLESNTEIIELVEKKDEYVEQDI